jgi:DNA transformation protein
VAVGPGQREFVLELFADLGDVSARAMMGGLAIYCRGRIFAIVDGDDRIYLKAGGPLAEALADEGGEQFTYARRDGRTARMGYWTLPDAALDDPAEASAWARRALASGDPDRG